MSGKKINNWLGFCQRCKGKTNSHTESVFDKAKICMTCRDREKRHPDFEKAACAFWKSRETGDSEFLGIGFPGWGKVQDKTGKKANIFEELI